MTEQSNVFGFESMGVGGGSFYGSTSNTLQIPPAFGGGGGTRTSTFVQKSTINANSPGLHWTSFSDECVSKLCDKMMDMYNKSGENSLNDLEIANFMGDSLSTSSTPTKNVNLADIKHFKKFHDHDKDGRYY